jgi:hypothetical protein
MSMVRLATLSLLMMFIQQVHCAASRAGAAIQPIVGMTEYGLVGAFFESELILEKLLKIMNNAHEFLLNKNATQVEDLQNVKIIIEHTKVMAMAIQKQKKMWDEIKKMKDVERDNAQMYVNELNKMTYGERESIVSEGLEKFVAGVKNVGAGIASFSTAGTGIEEQKAIARSIIRMLTGGEVRIAKAYALLQKDLTAVEKAQLKSRYDTVIAQIEAAIYEQEIIIGDTKSNKTKRDLLLEFVVAKRNAIYIINKAHELLLNKDATQAEDLQNVKIIIEHIKVFVMVEQKIEKMCDEIEKMVDKDNALIYLLIYLEELGPRNYWGKENIASAEGYWGKFVAGVKNVGAGIASFFTAGTGTEEEKAIARLIIESLTFHKQHRIAHKYHILLQEDLTAAEKVQLKSRYDAVIAQIEAAINEQKEITGDLSKGGFM